MTTFIFTVIAAILFEIALSMLRTKLFKLIEQSDHKNMLAKMYLPKKIFIPFIKPRWTPIKYVFKRKHKEINNKPLSKLSDLILVLYLVSWLLWVYFTLQLAIVFPYG